MKLSSRLSLYSLCVIIAVFIAIALVMEVMATRRESRQAERVTRMLQAEAVARLEQRLYSVKQTVRRSASGIAGRDEAFVKAHSSTLLRLMLESDTIIKGCCIAMVPDRMPDGREWMKYMQRKDGRIAESQLGESSYAYPTSGWFAGVVERQTEMWSEPYFDKGGGDCLMLTYSVPVKDDDGDIFAEITADLAISTIDDEIHSMIPYKGSVTFILDSRGDIIDSSESIPAQADRLKEIGEIPDLPADGSASKIIDFGSVRSLCCYTSVAEAGIVVCTATPVSALRSVAAGMRLPLLIILAAGFLLLAWMLKTVISRAMRPLWRLAEAAEKIGQGDFEADIPADGDFTELALLRNAMARMCVDIKEYVHTIENNARESGRIAGQLDIARDIQRSLLPAAVAETECGDRRFSIGAMQQSALEVGGDLYDYVMCGGRLYFIVADVSDKGIPAALMMAYIKSLFHFAAQQGLTPEDITARINGEMCENNPRNMFATLLLGCVDGRTEKMRITNAGHTPALIAVNGKCSFLRLPAGLPVGVLSDTVYTGVDIDFPAGSFLFAYTDGLSEAEDAEGRQFGEERILQTASDCVASGCSAPEMVERMSGEVTGFSAHHRLSDDITMLCLSLDTLHTMTTYLRHDISSLPDAQRAVREFCESQSALKETSGKLELVVEEAVSNIMKYSKPSQPDCPIVLTLKANGRSVTADITDSGAAFNPLREAPEVDTTLPLEERTPGGLGIFLIRNLTHTAAYERRDGKNHLTLTIKNNNDI